MSNEFLTDEFFLKIIRLGVEVPELKMEARKILARLHSERQGRDDEKSVVLNEAPSSEG